MIKVNESEVKNFMEKYSITYEEARQMWLEDNDVIENEEIEEMTRKAKENVKRYEKDVSKTRKKTTKERKVDTEKGAIIEIVKKALEENGFTIDNVKTETEINFNDGLFTLKLTRHRKKEK